MKLAIPEVALILSEPPANSALPALRERLTLTNEPTLVMVLPLPSLKVISGCGERALELLMLAKLPTVSDAIEPAESANTLLVTVKEPEVKIKE